MWRIIADDKKRSVKMNPANIVDTLLKDIEERLTFDSKNRVFNEGKELRSDFMKERAEPEAFTREFLIDKIFSALELEKLPEKYFEDARGHRSVDYLIKSPRGMFLVEAKPLNADLEKGKDSGVNQIKGLFKLVEVKENYNFGVATNGLRWIFIDKNKKIVSDLKLEDDFEQIKEFLIGKEKVVSPKTEEEISKKFYGWYNALLHGGKYKDHENKQKTLSEEDCLVNNVIGVKDLEEREQIAQVVMNRLIFIKFLQSKGIIEEDVLKYLSEVKEDELTPKLRQLFFGVLNTPEDQRQDINERFKDIPYLNGSLFTHIEVEKRNLDYKVKAEILKKVIEFLDSFKFVHKEQLGNGDSIDPEILGYIFERAMTSTDRKGTGAYYTPKPITKYISENTIYPYIIDRTNEILKTEKGYKDTELIKDIEELFILPATTLKEIWNKIIQKIRVLDNACGSGAFLLAAANILFALNRKISDKLGAENPDTTLKIWILVNNLYGVDINPNGIEIAKLRLWLWLADSYEPGYIKPLPNIDYNLRVGNSLIGYVDLSEFKKAKLTLSDFLWDEEKDTLDNLLKERNDLIREYKITWGEEAKELKSSVHAFDEKISNLLNADLYRKFREKKITISKEEFLKLSPFHWGFEFYEAFDLDKTKEERGFDVVIGNPPYVSYYASKTGRQDINPEFKKYLIYEYEFIENKKNLKQRLGTVMFFLEQAIHLTKDGGFISLIIDTNIHVEAYAKIRKYLVKKIAVLKIVENIKAFEGVSSGQVIMVYQNVPTKNNIVTFYDREFNELSKILQFEISYGNNFQFESVNSIVRLINKNSIALGKIAKVQVGYNIGGHKDFLTNKKLNNSFPYVSGASVQRYFLKYPSDKQIKQGSLFIIYDPQLVKFVTKRAKEQNKGLPGFGDKEIYFKEQKLFLRQSGNKIIGSFDDEEYRATHNLFIINKIKEIDRDYNLKYLLILLNSALTTYYAEQRKLLFSEKGKIPQITTINAEKLPFIISNNELPFIHLCDYMLFLNEKEERRESEKELIEFIDKQIIDSLVYELYFKEKFEEDCLKTNLLELVELYLKDIEGLETDEEELRVIKEVVKEIKSDGKIKKEIDKIKGHEWVKIIEGGRGK